MQFSYISSLFLTGVLFHLISAVEVVDPLPQNAYGITGSQLSFTCIVVGNNGTPPVKVKFQRKTKEVLSDWFDIPDTDRVFQTNKTEGKLGILSLSSSPPSSSSSPSSSSLSSSYTFHKSNDSKYFGVKHKCFTCVLSDATQNIMSFSKTKCSASFRFLFLSWL